jgi:proline iminopeptidase
MRSMRTRVLFVTAMALSLPLSLGARQSAVAQSSAPPTLDNQVRHPPGAYVEVNGAKLWYESEGKGEPLLLIAGGPGGTHDSFHPYFCALADSHRVIYFDAFGGGKSGRAKSPAEYTFNRDVEDVEGLRKALGLGKIIVLGHSYGGMVAQAYALKYPNSISKQVLLEALYNAEMWQAGNDYMNYEVQNQFPEVWVKIQALRSKGLHGSAKEHQDAYAIPPGLMCFHDASIAEKLREDFFQRNNDVYYTIAGDDADFLVGGDIAKLDFRTRLQEMRFPVLIMAGRYDRIVPPRYTVRYKEYAPQAQFVMMEHSGHFPFIEEMEQFFQVLRSFLGAAPADPAPSDASGPASTDRGINTIKFSSAIIGDGIMLPQRQRVAAAPSGGPQGTRVVSACDRRGTRCGRGNGEPVAGPRPGRRDRRFAGAADTGPPPAALVGAEAFDSRVPFAWS